MKCDEEFEKKRSFYNHYYVNHKEKTFKCDVCNMAFPYSSLLKIHQKKSCENDTVNYTKTKKEEKQEEIPKVKDISGDISSIELSSTDVFAIANVRENDMKAQNIKAELENKLESETCIKVEESDILQTNEESNEVMESKIDIDEKAYILGI